MASDDAATWTLGINTAHDQVGHVQVAPTDTVFDLKRKIQPLMGVQPELQHLVLKGVEFKDDLETLLATGVTDGSKVFVVAGTTPQHSPAPPGGAKGKSLVQAGDAVRLAGERLAYNKDFYKQLKTVGRYFDDGDVHRMQAKASFDVVRREAEAFRQLVVAHDTKEDEKAPGDGLSVDLLLTAIREAGHHIGQEQLQLVDGSRIGTAEALGALLDDTRRVDGALVVLGMDEVRRDLLLHSIGIQPTKDSAYMLIRAIGQSRGRPIYHLVEATEELDGEGAFAEGADGDAVAPEGEAALKEVLLPEVDRTLTVHQVFARTVARTWGMRAVSGSSGGSAVTWYATPSYSFTPSFEANKYGWTPPNKQTLTGSVTVSCNAYWDDAASGNFQWVVLESLGYYSTGGYWSGNGMTNDDRSERGYGNSGVIVTAKMPSGSRHVSSSPENSNGEKSVTTSVDFSVTASKSPEGSYGVSKSTSESVKDWDVKLFDLGKWVYQLNSPFKGVDEYATYPKKAISYNAGKARNEVVAWPTLTTNVFNWCTASVAQIKPPSTSYVTLGFDLEYSAVDIRVHNTWPTHKAWAWWWRTFSHASCSYKIDMGLVIAD